MQACTRSNPPPRYVRGEAWVNAPLPTLYTWGQPTNNKRVEFAWTSVAREVTVFSCTSGLITSMLVTEVKCKPGTYTDEEGLRVSRCYVCEQGKHGGSQPILMRLAAPDTCTPCAVGMPKKSPERSRNPLKRALLLTRTSPAPLAPCIHAVVHMYRARERAREALVGQDLHTISPPPDTAS